MPTLFRSTTKAIPSLNRQFISSLLENKSPPHTNRALVVKSDAIEDLVRPFGSSLVRLYFQHISPVFPILAKTRSL
ncbi:hypothetical protein BKA67DRAFT_579819, partial [Truncatella angustata]